MNPFLQASSLGFKTLFEFINTSAGINEFLFTGKERMAFGANFNSEITFRGLGVNNFTASATNGCIDIIRMDSFFHCIHLTFRIITVRLLYHDSFYFAIGFSYFSEFFSDIFKFYL